jgi:hypothetical protein
MNFCAHTITQRSIDQLVAGDWALAFKEAADNHGLEMMAVTLNIKVLTGQALGDITLNIFVSNHGPYCIGVTSTGARNIRRNTDSRLSCGCCNRSWVRSSASTTPERNSTTRSQSDWASSR